MCVKPKKIFFFFVFLFVFSGIKGQTHKYWQKLQPPVFQDCKQIQAGNDSLFINAGKLLVYKDSTWVIFQPQPPVEIARMFVIDDHQIYVSNVLPYQNSELFFWNGRNWKKIQHPVVNTISSMYFSDAHNGIISSFGEIVQLKNGKWQHLNPPGNRQVLQGVIYNKTLYILMPGQGVYRYKKNNWQKISGSRNALKLIIDKDSLFVTGKDFLGQIKDRQLKIISQNKIWQQVNSLITQNGEITAVGNKALVLSLKNNRLKETYLPDKQNLNQIYTHKQQIWLVGDEGNIYRRSQYPDIKEKEVWKGFKKLTFNQNAKIIDDEYSVVIADFNKDELPDIFTCGLFEEDHLYINQGNMQFTDKAGAFGINKKKEKSNQKLNLGACAGDIDNDGYIDLYISILNGKNILYKNKNGKYFIDYSSISGGIGKKDDRTNACIMGDVDNDGDLDIFIANEFSTNRLYLNNGAGIFREITGQCGLTTIEGGNSASFADIDLDGDLDLYVTNWSQPNLLYQNLLIETGKLQFKDISASSKTGGEGFEKSNAVVFTDFNNDTYPDLFVSNRKTPNRLYINNKDNTFSDKTGEWLPAEKDESYGTVITDFDADTYKDIYVSNVGENRFYKNQNGHFTDQTAKYGASIKGYSTGSALSDLDNDGDPDIYIANYLGEGSSILVNNASKNKFIQLKFQLYNNNINGIGTKIYLYDKKTNNLLYATAITAGSGYVSMNDSRQLIPYQPDTYLKIIWSGGRETIIDKPQAGSLSISDASGIALQISVLRRFLTRQFFDPHRLFEWIKWFFVLFFVSLSTSVHRRKYHWSLGFSLLVFAVLIALYYVQYRQLEYRPFVWSTLLPLSSIVLISLLLHYYFEQKHSKTEAVRKQKEIKAKLSRNLHDDLAATISSTGFYLEMMKYQLDEKNPELSKLLQKSEQLLQSATGTITDLIWSIQAQAENLENLLLRIQSNFQPLMMEKKILFEINWEDEKLKNIQVSGTTKQNIYLIIKEALNNILKYAGATTVKIEIRKTGKKILVKITDNGKGFDTEAAKNKGNGLNNMKKRAEELKQGIFKLHSGKNGTSLTISFQVKNDSN